MRTQAGDRAEPHKEAPEVLDTLTATVLSSAENSRLRNRIYVNCVGRHSIGFIGAYLAYLEQHAQASAATRPTTYSDRAAWPMYKRGAYAKLITAMF